MTTLPTYDIFKRSAENLLWIEASPDLATANARIKELQRGTEEDFVVFDQKTQELVVSNQP